MTRERREQIGARVRALRRARNWSIEYLAGEAGLSAKTVGRVENALGDARASTLRQIAVALGVPEQEFAPPSPELLSQLDRIEAKLDELLERPH